MNAGDIIARFGATYTATRRAKSKNHGGIFVSDPDPETFSIVASIQPYAATMDHAPEGRGAEETVRIFTATELRTGDRHEDFEADLVSYLGALYEVERVSEWPAPPGDATRYWDCTARRTDL